jgi:hypothetical protein
MQAGPRDGPPGLLQVHGPGRRPGAHATAQAPVREEHAGFGSGLIAGHPSQETVCDAETGAAYGLCNAYCEAMDCGGDDPQASQTACDQVAARFRRITGEDPPCLAPACRCVDEIPGFREAVNGQFGFTSCRARVDPNLGFVDLTTGDNRHLVAQSGFDQGCAFGTAFQELTEEEAQSCVALLRVVAAEADLTCTPD